MNTLASSSPVLAQRTAPAWITPAEIGLLGAIWGASFLFMRVAAPAFGAAALVEVRLALGALVLLPFLWKARAQFPLQIWPKLALIGAINSAIPFVLFAWAAQRSPAGVGAICNSMTVLFTALVGVLFFGETISVKRVLALLVGFGGAVVLASGKTEGASIGWAVVAGTSAAILYGFGINLVRRHVTGLPSAAVAASTLSMSALLVLPFAIAQWPDHAIAPKAWGAAVALGVMCTGFAFVFYYRLIARVGAARAATTTYVVPLFAVLWSWLLLGEAVTGTMFVAGLLILGSVAFSQRAK